MSRIVSASDQMKAEEYKVSRLIELLRDTPSINAKRGLVEEMLDLELGAFVIKWALDPEYTYGITPERIVGTGRMSLSPKRAEGFLQDLSSRKLSGNAAMTQMRETMGFLSPDGAELLFLILSKTLKCGFGSTIVNKIRPGFISEFKVMRAQKFEDKRINGWKMAGEPKLDGNRNTFLCIDGLGAFYTRSGDVVAALNFAVAPVMKVAKFMAENDPAFYTVPSASDPEARSLSFALDGEAMMGLFGDTGKLRRKNSQATGCELHLYDLVSYNDWKGTSAKPMPLSERRAKLESFCRAASVLLKGEYADLVQLVPQTPLADLNAVEEFYSECVQTSLGEYLARGDMDKMMDLMLETIDEQTGQPKTLEGAMIKNLDAPYERKKSYQWLKMKPTETEDLRIVGAFAGEQHKKYENTLGGVIVDRNGVECRIVGFSDKLRDELWPLYLQDMEFAEDHGVTDFNDFHGKLIGRLIEVKFQEVTPDGSLRHANYVRFRDDKAGEAPELEEAA